MTRRRTGTILAALLSCAACGAGEGESRPDPVAAPELDPTGGPQPVESRPVEPQPGARTTLLRPDPDGWPVSFSVPKDARARFRRVVLVTIDTLRRDHVSTPFLDSLAARGVLFENAVASVSHTAPSHATMLTGLHPMQHGVRQNGHELDAGAVDLARIFRRAKYDTAAFLNVHFLEGIAGSFQRVHVKTMWGQPVVEAATAWLQEKRAPKRFFLWIHLYDPHRWRKEEVVLGNRIRGVRRGKRWTDEAFLEHLRALHRFEEEEDGDVVLGPANEDGGGRIVVIPREEYVERMDVYDALVAYSDRQLKTLYETIEALDLPGETLWVVTSDHGEGLGSHRFSGHGGRIYQEQLRVPLVLHATDDSLGPRVVTELVQHVDLLPTLAAAAGARVRGLDPATGGASLWPLIDGKEGWQDRPAFSQRRPGDDERGLADLHALQTPRFKYIRNAGGEDEFYDLAADPLELEDLEGVPERESLRTLLEGRIELYGEGRRGSDDIPEEWLEELRALGYVE
jgi:arylsulfatase A-like enzyme